MIAVAISDHNLIPTDFRRVVDFFRMDFVNKRITLQFANSDLPSQLSDDDLQGVRLNCEGDRRICRRPYIENWRLPAGVMYGNIPSFEPGARIGIPLFATPIPMSAGLPWHDRRFGPGQRGRSDWNIHGLLFSGFEPTYSFLVVRTDRKPLYRIHALSFVVYCMEKTLGNTLEATFPDTGREFELVEKEIGQATGEMNERDFRLWYEEWSKRPHIQQLWESESGVGSPYDV
jgi:hypothetical protein